MFKVWGLTYPEIELNYPRQACETFTHTEKDMLSYWERKRRLPHGASRTIAACLQCTESMVSMVLRGVRRNRAVERALAMKMTPRTAIAEAFGPPAPVKMRQVRQMRTAA